MKFDEIEFKKDGELFFLKKESGEVINKVDIEISEHEEHSEKGMMHREKFNDDQGMLFILNDYIARSFWMKDTSFPLDIIFADSSKQIFKIFKDAKPFSEEMLSSGEPVKYAIEVTGGYCDRMEIKEGDTFIFDIF